MDDRENVIVHSGVVRSIGETAYGLIASLNDEDNVQCSIHCEESARIRLSEAFATKKEIVFKGTLCGVIEDVLQVSGAVIVDR